MDGDQLMGIKQYSMNNIETHKLTKKSKITINPVTNKEVIVLEKFSNIARIQEMADNLGISYYAVASILTNKKYKGVTEAKVKELLTASLNDQHPVESYPETINAIKHLKKAIAAGEDIGIYGDYDGDGVTSSLIIDGVLRDLMPAEKIHHQFSRVVEDGFDFSEFGLNSLAERGCKTIIVLDTGSNSVDTLKKAQELGIKCIVMDHHELNEDTEKVNGVTYINPHLHAGQSDENELKNAGLSWYFARKMYQETLGEEPDKLHKELLAYSALGTIADAGSQLEGPFNRALLYEGFQEDVLNSVPILPTISNGVNRFEDTSNKDVISAVQILSLGKRMSSVAPIDVFTSLSTNSSIEEREAAAQKLLSEHSNFVNSSKNAVDEIGKIYSKKKDKVLIEVASEKTIPADYIGTTGVVANRVSREFGVPAFVFVRREDGSYKGSYRTGDSKMNGMETLTRLQNKYPEVISKFGGHAAAGGVYIENEKQLNEFKDLMNQFVDYQVRHDPTYVASPKKANVNKEPEVEKLFTTASVPEDKILSSKLEDTLKLAPFSGFAIRKPTFYTQGLKFKERKGETNIFTNSLGEEISFVDSNKNYTPNKTYDIVFDVYKKQGETVYGVKDFLEK